MKKIGFIDYYIDEWHANNYPAFIRKSELRERFDVTWAWEETCPAGKKNLDQWCAEQKVRKAASIEQLVKECDCLVVLSPDNAERHEDLADLPLKSGKPVYIDKPIAPTLAAAKRLFAKAQAYKTPLMSSSALRFGSGLQQALQEDLAGRPVRFAAVRGGGLFHIYAIHQLEMLVMALGTGATRVMQCGNNGAVLMLIDYADGRRGTVNLIPQHPFEISLQYGDHQGLSLTTMDDFFPRFIEGLLTFFNTGKPLVPAEETLEIAALLEAGTRALARPEQWTNVPA